MRLAGIDIPAAPEIVMPIFLIGLLGLSVLVARFVRMVTARWLWRAGDVSASGQVVPPPKLSGLISTTVLTGGLLLVLPELTLPGRLGRWAAGALAILFIFSCTLILARLAIAAITAYGTRHASFGPALGVARGTVRIVFAVLAIVTALEALGVPVAPLLTTLGVGSLGVALALQDTLANFFAGVYLLADRPVGVGDYIKLADGAEGYVDAIGWRSSRLRTLRGSVVVVPNQKLSQAILTNFQRPSARVLMAVSVTVAHGSDAGAVEAMLREESARAVAEVAELRDAKPVVRLIELADTGQVWNCIAEVPSFEAQLLAGHELRKRLALRLRREKITVGSAAGLRVTDLDALREKAPQPEK
jgi:small-conductance mechanosensitive channel